MQFTRVIRFSALLLAALIAVSLCGCENKQTSPSAQEENVSAGQTYPVGSYERKAADKASSGEEDVDGEVINFGSKSIFNGIQIEADENGEIVFSENDGELWYKIHDSRFGSYRAFKRFVKQKAGSTKVDELSRYFGERDGALYFIIGARGCSIRDKSQYYLDDASKLTVNVIHTEECRKKYGIAGSDIHFVRKKGVWKLDHLIVYKD